MDYISKIEGHPLRAESLAESVKTLDQTPYQYRQTPITANRTLEKLIGCSCAFNQLCNNTFNVSNGTLSQSGTELTVTVADTTQASKVETNFYNLKNHIYLRRAFVKASKGEFLMSWYGALPLTRIANGNWQEMCDIIKSTYDSQNWKLYVGVNSINIPEYYIKDVNIIDLTAMFGSEVADYFYNLETQTAGAGVAKFRQLFPESYYAYQTATLISSQPVAKKVVGFNQWEEEWEVGTIHAGTGQNQTDNTRIRSKNYIRVLPNTPYYFKISTNDGRFAYYDIDKNFISMDALPFINKTFTTPTNCYYVRFSPVSSYGTTYNNDICINISDTNKNGAYEPYEEHTYPLGSDEIRGVFMIENGELVAYGDVHNSYGTGTKYFGIVDLGSISWVYDNIRKIFLSNSISSLVKVPATTSLIAHILCDIYTPAAATDVYNNAETYNKRIAILGTGGICVSDQSYNDAVSFVNAVNGKYLIYELATPTSETYTAFSNPMLCGSTEEFTDSRSVKMPCGHYTQYYTETEGDKLSALPDISDSGDGTYVVRQENGKQSLVTPNATDISYSNTSSELTATKVQGAIDEVNTKVGTKANSSDVYTKSNTYNKTEVNSMLTLIKTANGNPCTFDTDLADNLVSLTAEIVASGGGGTPSTPIPINGFTEANITRCGVNLFDEDLLLNATGWSKSGDYYVGSVGQLYTVFGVNGAFWHSDNGVDSLRVSYTAYVDNASANARAVFNYTDGTTSFAGVINSTTETDYSVVSDVGKTVRSITFDFSNDTTLHIKDFSINYPSTDTDYHPYTGNTYTITFGQTVYGGQLDVVRGKLTITWSAVDLGSLDIAYTYPLETYRRFQVTMPDNYRKPSSASEYTDLLSSIYKADVNAIGGNPDEIDFIMSGYINDGNVYIINHSYTDANAFKTAMSGVMLAYVLATPFDIDLTPVQISALVGTNNITSDLGGDVEVRYMAGEVASQVADIVKTELPDKPKYVLNEERIVGYWIDGKPIYEKLLSQTFSSGSDVVAIGLPYRTYAVLDAWGFLMYQDLSNFVLINGCLDATQSVYAIFNRAENDGILIKRESSSMGGSTPTVYVTVRYIKS